MMAASITFVTRRALRETASAGVRCLVAVLAIGAGASAANAANAANATSAASAANAANAANAAGTPSTPSTAVAPAASAAQPAPGDAPGGPALEVRAATAILPRARLEQRYAESIVTSGRAPFTFVVIAGRIPVGLVLDPATGVLQGLATEVGTFRFTLEIRDASPAPQIVRQNFVLAVDPRPAPPRPASAAAPKESVLRDVRPADADRVPGDSGPFVYRLTADDLKALLKEFAPEAAGEPGTEDKLRIALGDLQTMLATLGLPAGNIPAELPPIAPAANAPRPQSAPLRRAVNGRQLNELLEPTINIEYPTRGLFEAALRGRQCQMLTRIIDAAADGERVKRPQIDCTRVDQLPEPPARPGRWTLRSLHDSLLPREALDRAVELARKTPVDTPLAWREVPCGCAPGGHRKLIYGFFPHWRWTAKPAEIDFSLFNRVGVFGARLDDRGELMMPASWPEGASDFARIAQRHRTELDLVVYRDDWSMLKRYKKPAEMIGWWRDTARSIVAAANTGLAHERLRLEPLLLSWNEPRHVFDGITIFFDELPVATPADPVLSAEFVAGFLDALIEEMQAARRRYALNLVISDRMLGRTGGPFEWGELLRLLYKTEKWGNPIIPKGAEPQDYRGKTDITLRFIVAVSEPYTDFKKYLRWRLDHIAGESLTGSVTGHRRVALLDSIVPLMVQPPAGDPDPQLGSQTDDDLAYFMRNYGGAAFWPVLRKVDTGRAKHLPEVLRHNRSQSDIEGAEHGRGLASLKEDLCDFVCPNRTPLRFAWEALTVTGLVLLGLYIWVCRVNRIGRLWLGATFASIVASIVVGGLLLTCDPDLARLAQSNELLWVLLAAIGLVALWFVVRPRVRDPDPQPITRRFALPWSRR